MVDRIKCVCKNRLSNLKGGILWGGQRDCLIDRRLGSLWDVVKRTSDVLAKVRKRGKTKKRQFYQARMKLEVLLWKMAFHNIYLFIHTCIFRHTYLFVIILIFYN